HTHTNTHTHTTPHHTYNNTTHSKRSSADSTSSSTLLSTMTQRLLYLEGYVQQQQQTIIEQEHEIITLTQQIHDVNDVGSNRRKQQTPKHVHHSRHQRGDDH